VPADVTIAATSSSGASYSYGTVFAIDVLAGAIPATCTPPSGSLFPVGTTTVTCTATGSNQQTGTGTFTVTVQPFATPNQPPVLTLPADITVSTSSTSGKTVSFTVTATDDGAVPPTVTCSPPSGSRFPVGTSTVTCTAVDDQGASSTGSFRVTVIGPLERACALLEDSLGITLTDRLVSTLRAAADALHQAGRDGDARTIRSLAQKVWNAGTTYVRPALRQMVVQTVQAVMARAC